MRYKRNFFAAAAILTLAVSIPSQADTTPKLDSVNHQAYIAGSSGYFLPDEELSRAEASVILSRLMVDEYGSPSYSETTSYPLPFSDISEQDWFAPYIGFMDQQNVLKGYEDGTFHPEKGITRAEYTVLLSRFTQVNNTSTIPFHDVPSGYWAEKEISSAVHNGYLNGYGDGSFRPDNTVTRAEAVAILNRILGRTPDKSFIESKKISRIFRDLSVSHWAFYEIFEAAASHRYEYLNETENWLEVWDIPQYSSEFVSDKFHFILPELKTAAALYPLNLNKVDSIALHHMEHPTAGFRDIEAWHLQRGFDAIGYNFWIDFEGNVYVGRGWNKGAAVANQNGHIISIGFQGDFENVNTYMPQVQYQSGVQLIRWIQERVPTAMKIGGHGDFGATDCPGEFFPLQQMIRDAQK